MAKDCDDCRRKREVQDKRIVTKNNNILNNIISTPPKNLVSLNKQESIKLLPVGQKYQIPIAKSNRKKVLFMCDLPPGDLLMLSAAIRDLHLYYPGNFLTGVKCKFPEIWENNPYIVALNESDKDVMVIEAHYPLIHKSDLLPYHFIHGFSQYIETKLNIRIPPTFFKGDVFLSLKEVLSHSAIEDMGIKDKFWIIMAGGKTDFTCKYWPTEYYQEVVDYFNGEITFVQSGNVGDWHPPLKNVINLVGQTSLRQFINLIYHSIGVLCPVTFAMHGAAAVPVKKDNPPSRACVVIAGGREPAHWEAYPNHRFLSVNGTIDCCAKKACWRSRCQKIGDNDEKDFKNLCLYPTKTLTNIVVPKCMDMIKPVDVIRAIETYYEGGVLKYNDCK